MKITALQEYGMRCLMQLAEQGDTVPVRIRSIAKNEGLSADYVEKILTHLRRAGLVKSVRGLNGGYVLSKSPSQISIGDAINFLSEKPVQMRRLKKDLCGQFPGNRTECVHMRGCTIRQIWTLVLVRVFGSLNKIYLSDLLGNEAEVQNRLKKFLLESGTAEKIEVGALEIAARQVI